MSLILNRTTAKHAMHFFDVVFKHGVIDACEFGNDLDAKEFLDARRADWEFARLGSGEKYDWQAFRYDMYWLARRASMKTFAESYLFKIRSKNYPWCILPYCMRFYLMGVQEWLNYPNPSRIELFKTINRNHWDPNEPAQKITNTDIFSYLHGFEFEYRQLPEEGRPVSPVLMTSFNQALFDLTRKYVTASTEEEDL